MRIYFIYKIIPILVIYTNSFIKKWAVGKSYGFMVLIRPSHITRGEILVHELVHCRQFFRTLGLHIIFYMFSSKYRLTTEIEAYKATLSYLGLETRRETEWVVESLFNNYNLNITKESIRRQLDGIRQ